MKHLLLDVNIVVDACTDRGSSVESVAAIFTEDDALADKMCQIRIHVQKVKHQHPLVGINGRLDMLQAASLLEKPCFLKSVTFEPRSENAMMRFCPAFRVFSPRSLQTAIPRSMPSTPYYPRTGIACPNP